jgi:hypothetical protein
MAVVTFADAGVTKPVASSRLPLSERSASLTYNWRRLRSKTVHPQSSLKNTEVRHDCECWLGYSAARF